MSKALKENIEAMNESFYAFVRHMVSLATGSLTLLVALQGNYVKHDAHLVWLLKSSWILLGLAILSGIVVLYADVHRRYETVRHIHMKLSRGESPVGYVPSPGTLRLLAFRFVLYVSFALSFACLILFAVLN